MKKFSFRLEKTLSLKTFKEKEAKINLGRAISEMQLIQNQIDSIGIEKHAQTKARSNAKDIYTLQSIELYINRLNLKLEELFEALAKAQLIVEEKRKALQEAMKETKVLHKLKEKKQIAHRNEILLETEKILDDISNRKL